MSYKRGQFGIVLLALLVFVGCKKPLYPVNATIKSTNQVTVTEPDSELLEIIKPYKERLDAQMNRIIGFSEKELTRGPLQSTLGNFIIDLILVKSEEYYGKPIDFALVTIGGLRTPIPQGNVTVGNIYELMPFENELVVLTLKGSTVEKLLEHSVEHKNTQFAGLTYTIEGGICKNITIDGKPFDVNKSYTMSVSDYLAGGGDHLDFLKESEGTYQLGKTFRGAILEYIEEMTKKGENIACEKDDRVVVVE